MCNKDRPRKSVKCSLDPESSSFNVPQYVPHNSINILSITRRNEPKEAYFEVFEDDLQSKVQKLHKSPKYARDD